MASSAAPTCAGRGGTAGQGLDLGWGAAPQAVGNSSAPVHTQGTSTQPAPVVVVVHPSPVRARRRQSNRWQVPAGAACLLRRLSLDSTGRQVGPQGHQAKAHRARNQDRVPPAVGGALGPSHAAAEVPTYRDGPTAALHLLCSARRVLRGTLFLGLRGYCVSTTLQATRPGTICTSLFFSLLPSHKTRRRRQEAAPPFQLAVLTSLPLGWRWACVESPSTRVDHLLLQPTGRLSSSLSSVSPPSESPRHEALPLLPPHPFHHCERSGPG